MATLEQILDFLNDGSVCSIVMEKNPLFRVEWGDNRPLRLYTECKNCKARFHRLAGSTCLDLDFEGDKCLVKNME